MIIRVQKHVRDFTIIENRALQDERLSYKATGLLAYLLSLPSDWRINREDLAAKKADGVSAVRSALNELEACGYLARERKRLPNGTFQTTLIVHEHPGPDAKTARPEAENRAAEISTAEIQPPLVSTQTEDPDKEPPLPTGVPGRDNPDSARATKNGARTDGAIWALVKEIARGRTPPPRNEGQVYDAVARFRVAFDDRAIVAAALKIPTFSEGWLEGELNRSRPRNGRAGSWTEEQQSGPVRAGVWTDD